MSSIKSKKKTFLVRYRRAIIVFITVFLIMIILANNANSAIGKLRIIDGDTIVLNGEKIRLKGMDAPEMKQICWDNTKKEIVFIFLCFSKYIYSSTP